MEHLYAPWRYEYVSEEKIEGCIFCHISKNLDDDKLQVLFHDEHCYVVMNKFPYSPGHMMVIPHFHTDKIEDLNDDVWIQISIRVRQGVMLLRCYVMRRCKYWHESRKSCRCRYRATCSLSYAS